MQPIVNELDMQALIIKDPVFSSIHFLYGTPPNWVREPGFLTLAKIILEQQVSLSSAQAHFTKLCQYIIDFTPKNLLRLTDEEMRHCFISRQKARYLRALSAAVLSEQLNIDSLAGKPENEIRNKLMEVKGIGNWTTDVYLLFCLQAKDILPLGDVAVVQTIRELTGVQTRHEMQALGETWQPLRSLATFFLWHYYLKKRKRDAQFS